MKKYKFLIIFILIVSCTSNKGVYWCGDHACANNKEKEAFFKKTMIVEVRNLDKNSKEPISTNEKILNQSNTKKKKKIIIEEEFEQEINLGEEQRAREEREIEQQIEIQEQEIARKEREIEQQIEIQEQELKKMEKKSNQQIKPEEDQTLNSEKIEEKKLSTIDKVVEIKDVNSKSFDELVENIKVRNSTRSYPKINDIPK